MARGRRGGAVEWRKASWRENAGERTTGEARVRQWNSLRGRTVFLDYRYAGAMDKKVRDPRPSSLLLTVLGQWHAHSVEGVLVMSTKSVITILIGTSAALIHCTGDFCVFQKQVSPYLGREAFDHWWRKEGEGRGLLCCVDVVMHCTEDVEVILTGVSFVHRVTFDPCSFNGPRRSTLSPVNTDRARMLDEREFFHKKKFGDYVEAIRVAWRTNEASGAWRWSR